MRAVRFPRTFILLPTVLALTLIILGLPKMKIQTDILSTWVPEDSRPMLARGRTREA